MADAKRKQLPRRQTFGIELDPVVVAQATKLGMDVHAVCRRALLQACIRCQAHDAEKEYQQQAKEGAEERASALIEYYKAIRGKR